MEDQQATMQSSDSAIKGQSTEFASKKLVYVLIAIIIALLLSQLMLFSKISTFEQQINDMSNKITKLDHADLTATSALASIYMSNGVVTDSLVASKVLVDAELNSVVIDISPQPSFTMYFLGQGRFDLSDREIKQALLDLMASAAKQYDSFPFEKKFNETVVTITQNNYSVGTYSGGELKLVGEN